MVEDFLRCYGHAFRLENGGNGHARKRKIDARKWNQRR